MNERVKRLSAAIRKLSADEQAELVDTLLGSLHNRVDPKIEKAWADEAKRRWQAYLADGAKTTPADEVFAKLGRKRAKNR
jgi:putative addiction module component (TIGR02574 family)